MNVPNSRLHRMPFGAEVWQGGTRFRLWAPAERQVLLDVRGRGVEVMNALVEGWHELTLTDVEAGARYSFRLSDGKTVPDPASRFQPDDVHEQSEVIDPSAFDWQDGSWRGRPWADAVIYELHVGAFTQEGTFRAIIPKLDHLAALGVTALELMPIADFPGKRNWGYDGVHLYAPDASYGRPEDLKTLIDEAHARNLMVFLDVVYNHFGPDGNYLPLFAPQIFTERHKTPWGAAVNYDGDKSSAVREFVIHNALYWLEEFHFDGLRLDAVHAILDDSATHVLQELADRVAAQAGEAKAVHLILENEHNEARWLKRRSGSRPSAYTAQWNDDVHHGLHTAVTGEASGYYEEYKGDTAKLARAVAEGFAFQGEVMNYSGKPRGEPSRDLPPQAFVSFIQNHDQVGNRAFGDRLAAPVERLRAIAAIFLLSPQTPMLFMGQEWGATSPFPFFCDFAEPLAGAVREGRRGEFARFPEFQDEQARARIPDPTAKETFSSAKLEWGELQKPPHSDWLRWYRDVLEVRRHRVRGLCNRAGAYAVAREGAFQVEWQAGNVCLTLLANLRSDEWNPDFEKPAEVLWREGQATPASMGPWSVLWLLRKEVV